MIVESILVLGGLGLLFGIFLAFASKKFEVKLDPRVEQILKELPNANCGACGYAGCAAYAEALISNKETPPDMCVPGQKEVAEKIAKIVGRDVSGRTKPVAQFRCAGSPTECKDKVEYKGIKTCKAANLVSGGPKSCSYGCIMFGDCIVACKFGALSKGKNGLPMVDKEKCIACGACVKACPKRLFSLVPREKKVHVICSSKNASKDVIKACKVGCIACKACERVCPVEGLAIHVKDNLAEIEYAKCIMCGKCAQACPRKIILDERPKQAKDL